MTSGRVIRNHAQPTAAGRRNRWFDFLSAITNGASIGMKDGPMKEVFRKAIAKLVTASSVGIEIPEKPIAMYLELLHLRTLLERLNINCVLDVGANRGQFATELRASGYRGYIVSFEPIGNEFALLQKRFGLDKRWKGYQIALGSVETSMHLNVVKNLTVMSSLLTPIRMEKAGIAVERVEVRRLDNLFPSILAGIADPRVFLKMDTQGYDLEVFKGAGNAVRTLQGLQSELSVKPIYEGMPNYLEALSTYEEAGFDLYNLSVVSRARISGLIELNCSMQRSTGTSRL